MTDLHRRHILGAGSALAGASLFGSAALGKTAATAAAGITSHYGPFPGEARLRSNENPYGPSPKAVAAMQDAVAKGAYYPWRTTPYLQEMIAERNGVSPDQVTVTTGSSECLSAAGLAYAAEGKLLAPALTFDSPYRQAEAVVGPIKRVPLKADLSVDLEAMETAVTDDVSLVVLVNPNNPTGEVIDGEKLRAFVRRVGPKAAVLIDEAYIDFVDDMEATSLMDMVRAGENVIVTRTFSKIYGMGGMRIGYSVASPEVTERIAHHNLTIPNLAGVVGAIASLNDEAFLAMSRARIREGREMVEEAVTANGLSYVPSGAAFVYVDVGMKADDFVARMKDKNISVRGSYGDAWANWSRVSMGKIEDMKRYCDAIPYALNA